MKIKPIGNRILIEPILDQTPTGIIIPETVKRSSHRQFKGKIVGVPKKLSHLYSEGMQIIFDDYGERVDWEGKTYTFLDPEYIHGVLE